MLDSSGLQTSRHGFTAFSRCLSTIGRVRNHYRSKIMTYRRLQFIFSDVVKQRSQHLSQHRSLHLSHTLSEQRSHIRSQHRSKQHQLSKKSEHPPAHLLPSAAVLVCCGLPRLLEPPPAPVRSASASEAGESLPSCRVDERTSSMDMGGLWSGLGAGWPAEFDCDMASAVL